MTFDLTKQAEFGMSKEDIEKLRQFQIQVKTRYGDNEHHATVSICKEIGCDEKIVRFVDNLEWKSSRKRVIKKNQFKLKFGHR